MLKVQNKIAQPLFHISAVLFVWVLMLVRVFYFYHAPLSMQVAVVPDDAFYYIQLAQHHLQEGGWHFDGQTSTTGFHLLYAYFLVFIMTLTHVTSWPALYLMVGLCSATAIAVAAYFSLKSSEILFGFQSSFWSLIPYLTIAVLLQSNMMMDSWLVIFFASLGFYYFLSQHKHSFFNHVFLIFLGFLGSLSRSDFGLFPGILSLVFLISFNSSRAQEIKRSFLWLFGATLGLCAVWLNSYFISGHFTQASAQTKFYWSSLMGHDIQISWQFIKSIVVPHGIDPNLSSRFWKISFLICFSCLWFSRQFVKENRSAYLIAIAALLTLGGYTVIYRYNSAALQIWYVANYVTPLCIMAAAFGSLISKSFERFPIFKKCSFIPLFYALAIYFPVALKHVLYVPWVHQAGMMYAGLHLKDMKTEAKFAAWNAGIISYFSGLNVMNLDGLVNDEILPYIKEERLLDYIQEKHIHYLVDYEFMLDNFMNKKRGGYADGKLRLCLIPLNSIDDTAPEWPDSPEHSRLKLFKVKSECFDMV